VDIFLLFLERSNAAACLRWPLHSSAGSQVGLPPIFIAWTAWREFVLLQNSQSLTNLDALTDMIVPLRPHLLSRSWLPPPVQHCTAMISNPSQHPGADSEKLSVIIDDLECGLSLTAVEHQVLLSSLSSRPDALANHQLPLYSATSSATGIFLVRVPTGRCFSSGLTVYSGFLRCSLRCTFEFAQDLIGANLFVLDSSHSPALPSLRGGCAATEQRPSPVEARDNFRK
jgi:hypothetical protein